MGDKYIRGIGLNNECTTLDFKGDVSLLALTQNQLTIHRNKVKAYAPARESQ